MLLEFLVYEETVLVNLVHEAKHDLSGQFTGLRSQTPAPIVISMSSSLINLSTMAYNSLSALLLYFL